MHLFELIGDNWVYCGTMPADEIEGFVKQFKIEIYATTGF